MVSNEFSGLKPRQIARITKLLRWAVLPSLIIFLDCQVVGAGGFFTPPAGDNLRTQILRGLSDDGRTVLFRESKNSPLGEVERDYFLWNRFDGLEHIGDGDIDWTELSGDGHVVLGRNRQDDKRGWVRRDTDGNLDPITISEDLRIDDVSFDGSVAVGHIDLPDSENEAVRLHDNLFDPDFRIPSDLFGFAPNRTSAHAISADGRVIFGSARRFSPFVADLFRWTERTGFQSLNATTELQGDPDDGINSLRVSSNGTVLGGTEGDLPAERGILHQAFLWTEVSGFEAIPLVREGMWTQFHDMSSDGTVVLGRSPTVIDGPPEPFLWTAQMGSRMLSDILIEDYGLTEISDWDLYVGSEMRMSADGLVIAGSGIDPSGDPSVWVAVLDVLPGMTPGDFNSDIVQSVDDIDLLTGQIRAQTHSPEFDLNEDQLVDGADLAVWIQRLNRTYFGDANLDGEFNSRDLVAIFEAGQYEDSVEGNSTWTTGDWNGDGDFTTSDLIAAFEDGGYENGPRPAITAVPEPTSCGLLACGLVGLATRRRTHAHYR